MYTHIAAHPSTDHCAPISRNTACPASCGLGVLYGTACAQTKHRLHGYFMACDGVASNITWNSARRAAVHHLPGRYQLLDRAARIPRRSFHVSSHSPRQRGRDHARTLHWTPCVHRLRGPEKKALIKRIGRAAAL
uniref:Uncharacterized protein n=1 Tax=Haptolina ericina TaxID=156174 RepID=A0A7S3BSX1_9EUKA